MLSGQLAQGFGLFSMLSPISDHGRRFIRNFVIGLSLVDSPVCVTRAASKRSEKKETIGGPSFPDTKDNLQCCFAASSLVRVPAVSSPSRHQVAL
jgi:hypothetical protein